MSFPDVDGERVDLADALNAAPLAGGKRVAYPTIKRAAANRPSLLVSVPTLDWKTGTLDGTPTAQWRVIALADRDQADDVAVAQLLRLGALAESVLPIDGATWVTYPLGQDRVPALVLTFTLPTAP